MPPCKANRLYYYNLKEKLRQVKLLDRALLFENYFLLLCLGALYEHFACGGDVVKDGLGQFSVHNLDCVEGFKAQGVAVARVPQALYEAVPVHNANVGGEVLVVFAVVVVGMERHQIGADFHEGVVDGLVALAVKGRDDAV